MGGLIDCWCGVSGWVGWINCRLMWGLVAARVVGLRLVWGVGVGLLPALVDVLEMVVLSL